MKNKSILGMEFKFKAFHKSTKTMIDFDLKKAANDIYIAANIIQLLDGEVGNFYIRQSTKAHDRNGVEIFDGSIVQIDGITAVVLYSSVDCAFRIFKSRYNSMSLSSEKQESLTVIGDIFVDDSYLTDKLMSLKLELEVGW